MKHKKKHLLVQKRGSENHFIHKKCIFSCLFLLQSKYSFTQKVKKNKYIFLKKNKSISEGKNSFYFWEFFNPFLFPETVVVGKHFFSKKAL